MLSSIELSSEKNGQACLWIDIVVGHRSQSRMPRKPPKKANDNLEFVFLIWTTLFLFSNLGICYTLTVDPLASSFSRIDWSRRPDRIDSTDSERKEKETIKELDSGEIKERKEKIT